MAPSKESGGRAMSAREARYEMRVKRQEAEESVANDLKAAELRIAEFRDFQLFPKLPTELRLMVWNYAIVPRVLFLYPFVKKSIAIPAVLHVCQESRSVALKRYERVTGLAQRRRDWTESWDDEIPRLRVTFCLNELDTLYNDGSFDFVELCDAMKVSKLQNGGCIANRVRRVALRYSASDFNDMFGRNIPHSYIPKPLDTPFDFKNLEELIVIIDENRSTYSYIDENIQDAKFKDISDSIEEVEKAKSVEELYKGLIKEQQAKRGIAWKAPKLTVKHLVLVKEKKTVVSKREPRILACLR